MIRIPGLKEQVSLEEEIDKLSKFTKLYGGEKTSSKYQVESFTIYNSLITFGGSMGLEYEKKLPNRKLMTNKTDFFIQWFFIALRLGLYWVQN